MLTELRRFVMRPLFGLGIVFLIFMGGYPLIKEKKSMLHPLYSHGISINLTPTHSIRCEIPKEMFLLMAMSASRSDFGMIATIVLGGLLAGSLASDRKQRYTTTILVRGYSKGAYLFAKALAIWFAAWIAMGFAYTVIAIALKCLMPDVWHSISLSETCQSAFFNKSFSIDVSKTYGFGPILWLAIDHPFLNDLLGMVYTSLGVASISLVGLVAGSLFPNPFIAAATPIGLVIALQMLPSPFQPLHLWNGLRGFETISAEPLGPYIPIFRWVTVSFIAVFISYLIFSKYEKE